LLQTAEGDLSIIQDNLQRIRDLAVQAANGTNGTAERAAIQSEVQQRIDEIDRIASASSFNSIKLLDGTSSNLSLQIGTKSTPSLNAISLTSGTINPLGNANASTLGIGSISSAFASASAAASFISSVDTAISSVSEKRSTIGSLQNRLESAITSLNVQFENMSASESRIRDVDVAKEAANLTKNQILQQASATLLAQANQAPSVALSLI
ncbi:MAG: hypothetical protein A2Y25_00540, partial [Candidatus Melainabacteria bacterium GWF2_37_15]